jgi:hypothetical protein
VIADFVEHYNHRASNKQYRRKHERALFHGISVWRRANEGKKPSEEMAIMRGQFGFARHQRTKMP